MHRADIKHRKERSEVSSSSQLSATWNLSRCSSLSDPDNDYLQETRRIAALGEDIRREIERRFHRSRTNATYEFPRNKKPHGAPNPPPRSRIPSVLKLQAENLEIRKKLKTKSAKSIGNSRNTSFTKLNDSSFSGTVSNASLNASFQASQGHSRNVSLTKQLPRNQPKLQPSLTRPTLQKPAIPSLHRKTGSRLSSKPRTRKGAPLSLDTSILSKSTHSKPFIPYERLY